MIILYNTIILVTCYAPFGSPNNPWKLPDDPSIFKDETLIAIGKKYKKTSAQITIKWQIQRGLAVIPKSTNPERLKQNADVS